MGSQYAALVTFSTADSLRDALTATYDDPNREPIDLSSDDLTRMLDLMLRRIGDINAEAHIHAHERTMIGTTEGSALMDGILDVTNNAAEKIPIVGSAMKMQQRLLRSKIGRGVAKVALKVGAPEIPSSLANKAVDYAGNKIQQRDARNKAKAKD